MPSSGDGPHDPREKPAESTPPPAQADDEGLREERGLDGDVDADGQLDEVETDDGVEGPEASGPAQGDRDDDLSALDEGEGHDDDSVGADRAERDDGVFEEDDARADDDDRGPAHDDDRALTELEDERDDGGGDDPDPGAGGGDDELVTDDDGDDDGGAEGIAAEDPSDAIEEPPAMDGADGEGEGLDEPLPELDEPS